MKTSIAALIAAGLFLTAAYFGVGSRPARPPASPQLIVLAGGSAGTAENPPAVEPAALPSPSTSTVGLAAGSAQVLGIGHLVQRNSLKDLTSSTRTSTGGPDTLAAGDTGSPGTENGGNPLDVNTQIQPGPSTSPLPSIAPPTPRSTPNSPSPILVIPSNTPLGFLFPSPSHSPTPTPTPSVTSTVTPTSTAHP